MATRRRRGIATLSVLKAIADGYRYGFDIMDTTELPGGTVYPALASLEKQGLVQSAWEDPLIAQEEKRPPRRYYQLTRGGRRALEEELAQLRAFSAAPSVAREPSAGGEDALAPAGPSPRKA